MKILFFGDIVGKIGRHAVKKVLPKLKEKYQPDIVIANVENLAHGLGITEKTLKELQDLGMNAFTSGDHIFDKVGAEEIIDQQDSPVIKPANLAGLNPGRDYKIIEVNDEKLLMINLIGQVFMKHDHSSPFEAIDRILEETKGMGITATIIDLHAEATSEKIAFGWYVDGRVSAVLGTHTHVPTDDAIILPKGTAYVSDVGMVGATNSVLGVTKELSIDRFLNRETQVERIPEKGDVRIGAMLIETNTKTHLADSIKRVDIIVRV